MILCYARAHFPVSGENGKAAYGCYGGESLPSESKRCQLHKVSGICYLACGVRTRAGRKILFRHAAAIVRYTDSFYSPAVNLDRNRICPAVNSIVHKLPYNRIRTVYYFSCRNLSCYFGTEGADRSAAYSGVFAHCCLRPSFGAPAVPVSESTAANKSI